MKVLLSIASCVKYARDNKNQAQRDTFLNAAAALNLDYKFFMGDGTPMAEDSAALDKSFNEGFNEWVRRFPSSPAVWEKKAVPQVLNNYSPASDEILLAVPDDYKHLTYKMRVAREWAVQQGYEFIFHICPDTYVDLPRLMTSGFQKYDYTAKFCGGYGEGGPGYWLSAHAARLLIKAPVTDWAEDRWVGNILQRNGIRLREDRRYANYPQRPQKDNSLITSHLANVPTVYDVRLMYAVHEGRMK